MPQFQADFQAWSTIYVEAENEEAARRKIEDLVGKSECIEIGDDVEVDAEGSFISAAMTCTGTIGEVDRSFSEGEG